MIVKQGSKFAIKSEHSGRKLGTYASKTEAEKRLKEIEYFKHKLGARLKKPSMPKAMA